MPFGPIINPTKLTPLVWGKYILFLNFGISLSLLLLSLSRFDIILSNSDLVLLFGS